MSTRILITRSEADASFWVDALAERGIEAVAHACIETKTIDTPATRRALAEGIADADWLVLTSKRGAAATAELFGVILPARVNIAVVGATTKEHAEQLFGRPALVADQATAVGLATTLCATLDPAKTGRIVLALAENAGPLMEEMLVDAGFDVLRIDVYQTVPRHTPTTRQPLSSTGCDTVFLASPSAVEGFMNQFSLDTPARIVTIGPSTTAAARGCGLDVHGEANEPSLEGLLEATQR
jgi:uroporphyrinogen-III synthase